MRRERSSWHRASIVAPLLLALGTVSQPVRVTRPSPARRLRRRGHRPGRLGAIPIYRATSRRAWCPAARPDRFFGELGEVGRLPAGPYPFVRRRGYSLRRLMRRRSLRPVTILSTSDVTDAISPRLYPLMTFGPCAMRYMSQSLPALPVGARAGLMNARRYASSARSAAATVPAPLIEELGALN